MKSVLKDKISYLKKQYDYTMLYGAFHYIMFHGIEDLKTTSLQSQYDNIHERHREYDKDRTVVYLFTREYEISFVNCVFQIASLFNAEVGEICKQGGLLSLYNESVNVLAEITELLEATK